MSANIYDASTKTLTPYAGSQGSAVSTTLTGLSDVTISSPTNGQVLKYDATHQVWVNGTGEGGSSVTVLSQTLTSGNTSVTFSNIPTTGNYLADFFTSTGINYIAIDTSTAGQVILTFEVQSVDVIVYCKLEEVG